MLSIFPVSEGFPTFLMCFYSVFRWRLLCHDSCFHWRISIWSRCSLDLDWEFVHLILGIFPPVRVFPPFFCVFTLFFGTVEFLLGFWASLVFLRDEGAQFRVRISGYIAVIHAFFGGFRVSPDAAWIEIKSLFFGFVILVWTVDLADFKIRTCRIFFALSFFLFMH